MNDKTTTQTGDTAAPEKPTYPSNYMSTGMDMGTEGLTSEIGGPVTQQGNSPILDVESGKIEGRIDLTDDEKLALAETEALATDEDGEKTVTEEAQEGDVVALPEFDPEKPEAVKAYEDTFRPNGKLDLKALGSDWFKNAGGTDPEALAKGKLSDGTTKWLNSIGIDDSTIAEVTAAQVERIKSQSTQATAQVVAIAGSAEALEAALKWGGKEGGYTAAQIERFNKAYKGGDPDARAEAVEALMARYGKANPKGRTASPKVTTQTGGNAPAAPGASADVYKSADEHRKEFAAAHASKDPAKIAAVRAKLERSSFWKK